VLFVESSGAFTTVSDRKFKTNIQTSNLGLDFVMRLRPVTYNMFEGHEGILYTGLIAQELEQVVDDMGVEFSGLKRPANESDHYGVSYATLTIPLIKAVQEQQAEIDALRAENAALRRQVDYIMTVIEGRDE
jgi:trimeric autotransporter adhesin